MIDQNKQKAVEIYWLNKLSGTLPKISLPRYGEEKGGKPGKEQLRFEIAKPVLSKLLEIGNNSHLAVFILLLSALKITLHKYTGLDDILVGTLSPKKEGVKSSLIFCRTRIDKDLTLKETINRIKEDVMQDFDYVDYSFGTLYQKLAANRDMDSLEIFNAAFIYDKLQEKSKLLNQYNLVFTFSTEEEQPSLLVDYKADLYTEAAVTGFCRNLIAFFADLPGRFESKISAVEITGPEERELLDKFNETEAPFSLDKTIPQLFEEQAAENPGLTAVVCGSRRLTYGDLNIKANRLARVLVEKGVKKCDIVGLMLERSIEAVVAMLAVLKAGGAYLPIDPQMPKNRILTMLEDCNAKILITGGGVMQQHPFTALQGLNDKQARPVYTPKNKQITDLDSLPLPDRSLVDLEKYNRYIGQVMVKDVISLQTARGCPYNCSYCSKIWHKKHVYRSAGKIFDEMQMYYDMGVRRFSFFDDIFNVNRENSSRFFEMVIKKGLDVQLFFPNGLRGDLLTKDYIDLLVEAGLVCTALALETASPRLQKLINKNSKLDIFRENAEYFCNKYPQVVLELFAMHGFPTETEEEAGETMGFIKSLKWLHFPYLFMLKVYPDTEMADLAVRHGVLHEDILRSEDLAFHDLSPTSPFKKSFTQNYRAEFLNGYFLNKERLLHVLPYQVKVFTEDEIVQKYDSYLPTDIKSVDDLLKLAGIKEDELKIDEFIADDHFTVPGLNRKIKQYFPVKKTAPDALRVLFLDLSQYFSSHPDMLYDVVEPPLGGIYVMTYLKEQLGDKVDTKIVKSRIDFDSYDELKKMLAEFDPQVIGVRALTFYRDFFHKTIQAMRQWGIDVPIIAGGPYATRNYDALLQDRNIDLLVKSEGETVFCEIIGKILENNGKLPAEKTLREINGIGFVPRASENGSGFAREIILLDELSDDLSPVDAADPEPISAPGDPAYVIFTSGSTGKPKGVMVEHRNVLNTLLWFARRYDIKEDVRVAQLTNYTFDPSVEQIFATLMNGATLYMPEDGGIVADREEFRAFIEQNKINVINFLPGVLKELLGGSEKLPGVRTVISGAEKLEQAVKDRLMDRGYDVYNHYGPTETTIEALTDACSAGKVTLGKPIANTSVFILDKDLNLAPIGVTGELCIAGAGVSRGYLNRPELTAEKFITTQLNKSFLGVQGAIFQKSPLSAGGKKTYNIGQGAAHPPSENHTAQSSSITPQQSPLTLYRTGDLARWLPEGKVEFLGRIDHQVKIRGFRIELGEIESRLSKYKEIKEAVVIDRLDEKGDKYLCAYYTLAEPSGEAPESSDLRRFLSESLPDYMVPAQFVQLDKLPLNPSGKIDRGELPEPGFGENVSEYAAPTNEVEETLAGIWSEVLGIGHEKIGIDNNFFEIGGDSIKVIQISAKLRKHGMKLESGDLFANPTIRQLGTQVKPLERKIDQEPITGELPLTPVQEWFFQENMTDKHHYNQAVMLYSKEGFVEEAVRGVFAKIQEHHDALRITFREENGRVIQENNDLDFPLALYVEDFRGKRDRKAALEELQVRVNEIQAGIDLEEGPLMKLGLFHMDDGDRLLIVIHHLLVDGISWRILFEDIETLYRQYRDGKPFALPLKTDSFQYWAGRLRQYAGSKAFLAEQESYWAKIDAAEAEQIETDFDGSNFRNDSAQLSFRLNEEETEQLLTEVNRAFGTEINDILLTALGLGLRESFGKDRFPVSLEGHGREGFLKDMDVNRTIGWFTCVYPVIIAVPAKAGETAAESLSRHIKEVKESLHRVPTRGVGYGLLKYMTGAENKKEIEFKLKPGIGFNYLGQFDADVEQKSFGFAEESSGRNRGPVGERELLLDINGMIAARRLRLSLSYSREQFKEETLKKLMDNYKKALTGIISFCVGREEKESTPSDFDYKDLSLEDLEDVFE